MRVAELKTGSVAMVSDDAFVLIGEVLSDMGALPKPASMIDFISRYESLQGAIPRAMEKGKRVKLDPRQLKPPVERPSQIWAAAANFKRGAGSGLGDAGGRGAASRWTPEELLEMTFLKPPSAVIGPEEEIILPEGGRKVFPELKLCIVIGKKQTTFPRTRGWRRCSAIR